MRSANKTEASHPLVFIDDAHTFGGAQIALAWAVRAVLRNTSHFVVCVCPARTRQAILDIAGQNDRLRFIACPVALPLNIVSFPLRIPPFCKMLFRLKRQGVAAWWLNLAGVESCLAPRMVLQALGEKHAAWLHCTETMSILFPGLPLWKSVLNRVRDLVANYVLFRIHPALATPSKAASEIMRLRMGTKNLIPHLYPTVALAGTPPADAEDVTKRQDRKPSINLWMIGRVHFGHKNNAAALDTFRALKKRGFETFLTIVGDGPDMTELRARSGDLKPGDGLTFAGWRADPWLGVAPDDVVLIPSFWEGMPLVAIEAMLRGVRLVTSPLPMFYEGIPQQFIAGGFSGEALADQVERVLSVSRSDVLASYSQALLKFSEEQFLGTFLALSSRILNGSSLGATRYV